MEEKNIIIFDDSAVFSSFSKDETVEYLRYISSFLESYDGPFPLCASERILITVTNISTSLSSFFISSSVSAEATVEMLDMVIELLANDETEFFCPDETF